ncbi:MFS transporter [uncultured Microbacterium sp.]|uniref:MFS transporter n=1 Tax=uncultured Microbacterium sp. TaxID=191216 RepID=UPI00260B02F9|nr:MFS transporter [uncultured Microbacterium sp.]
MPGTLTPDAAAASTRELNKGAILTIVLVSYFMILLDNSVIFTGLPSLQQDLGLSAAALAWVQDAYTLVFGGLLLLGARAGDLLGRKPVFVFGLAVFSVASLLIALSPAGWWLIAARAIQGIGAAVVLLAVFILAEARASQPIMPLMLFASRMCTGAFLARMLYLGAMIGFFFFVSQYLQESLGFTPLQAGLAFLPMTLVNFAVAAAIPRITVRFGDSIPLVAGIAITFGGMLWLSLITVHSDYLTAVALPMLLIGAGQGLAFAPLTTFGIAGVTAAEAGAASGAVNTFHQVGSSLGLGILVTVSAAASASPSAAGRAASEASAALTAGSLFLLCAVVIAVAVVVPGARAACPQGDKNELTEKENLV